MLFDKTNMKETFARLRNIRNQLDTKAIHELDEISSNLFGFAKNVCGQLKNHKLQGFARRSKNQCMKTDSHEEKCKIIKNQLDNILKLERHIK